MQRLELSLARSVLGLSFALIANLVFGQLSSGSWDKIRFVGNSTYSTEQLRKALIAEPDYLSASHPLSDRLELTEVVERLLTAGYRNTGFPECKVKAQTSDDETTTYQIDEGTRIRCGGVRITGASRIDESRLIERLTKPYPAEKTFPSFVEVGGQSLTTWVDADGKIVKPESPVWERGIPSRFGNEERINHLVKVALTDIGWSESDFSASLDTNVQDATAELVVNIEAEGAPDQVDVIHVFGSNVNAPNDVLDFLELKPGVDFNVDELQRLTKKLWDCGRFSKHNLRFDRDDKGRGRLNIELADVTGVPPLKEPINEAAQVLLRARSWLGTLDQRGYDTELTLHQESARIRLILSPQGIGGEFVVEEDSNTNGDEWLADRITFIVDPTRIELSQTQSPQAWSLDIGSFQGSVCLATKFSASESDDDFARFNLGFSCHSSRSPDEPLITHALRVSPSDWMGFAYKKNIQIQQHDNRLRISRNDDVIEIDSVSGEIYHWSSERSEVKFQMGLFEQFQEATARESTGKSNLFDKSAPISSLARWLLSEPTWRGIDSFCKTAELNDTELDPTLRSAGEKLITGGLLKPLDVFVKSVAEGNDGEQFLIPDESSSKLNLKRAIGFLVAKPLLRFAPDLFAEGTWPMTVVREASLVMIDRGKHTPAVLKALHADPSNGPLCDASIAYLLSLTSQKKASVGFARSSIRKMNAENYDRDIRTLLSGKSGQWFSDVLVAVASLSGEELDAVASLMPNAEASELLRDVHYRSTLSPFKEREWLQAGRSGLENVLEGIIRR